MSKQYLQMTYHPAKKEVEFKRFVDGKEKPIRNDSILATYMGKKGSFILQNHGNIFFEDIANAFDGEREVEIKVITTKKDYEDFEQMVEYYNSGKNGVIFNVNMLAELPDMTLTFNLVSEYGKDATKTLKKLKEELWSTQHKNQAVEESINDLSSVITGEIQSITEKINSMTDTNVNLCFVGVYSAGKSSLINAILGHKILPEALKSETAKMVKIKSPADGEPIRIVFCINYEHCELIWNNQTGTFDFLAAPNENETRKNIQKCINDNSLKSCDYQICEILRYFNNNSEDIDSEINLYYPVTIGSAENSRIKFTIYDTPGSDSNYGEHATVLMDALASQTNSILIFVASPDKLEGEGNSVLLSYLKDAEFGETKTSIDINRSIFVINKADSENTNPDELSELYRKKLTSKENNDFSISLIDKKLFFASAKYGYAAKSVKNQSAGKAENFIVNKHLESVIDDDFGKYYRYDRIASSEISSKRLLDRNNVAFINAQKISSNCDMMWICSGVYAIEQEILDYGEKFAEAVRAFAIIDSVEKALETMAVNADSIEANNRRGIEQKNQEIAEIKNTIKNAVKAAREKYSYPENDDERRLGLMKELNLDSDSISRKIDGDASSELKKNLKGWFLGILGKKIITNETKNDINQAIVLVVSDYRKKYIEKRKKILIKIRDMFISDVTAAIEKNGKISPEAKKFILNIKSPKISEPKDIKFDYLVDELEEEGWFGFKVLDQDEFIEKVKDELYDKFQDLADEFNEEYNNSITTLLGNIEHNYTDNLESYSLQIKAVIEDKKAMESLGQKIAVIAQELRERKSKLDEILWRAKNNG